MKIFVLVLAVFAITSYVTAGVLPESSESVIEEVQPTHLEDVDTDGGIIADPAKPINRYRRLTCDLFSFESGVVSPHHSACATKCIVMGRNGGHCEGTTCKCRDDKWTFW